MMLPLIFVFFHRYMANRHASSSFSMRLFVIFTLLASAIPCSHGGILKPRDLASSISRELDTSEHFVDQADYGLDTAPKLPLSVCQCDNVGECVEDQVISEQEEVFLCVSTSDGLDIAGVRALTFQQDGLTFSPIIDGKSNEYTWLVKNGDSCMIRTRLDSDFFKPSFRGTKRKSLMADGTIVLGGDALSTFEMELPLETSRLTSYVSAHGIIIAYCILLLLVIGLWAAIVTMASMSRNRPEDLPQEEVLEIEERRLMAIYTIWHQSQWSQKQSPHKAGKEMIHQTVPVTASETWSTSSNSDEEEKEEIVPYNDDESLTGSMSTEYAANNA